MPFFQNMRRDNGKTTYFFFAGYNEAAMRYVLKEEFITGWEIISKKAALERLPAGFQIPEVHLDQYSPRVEKFVLCLVSHYDIQDLERGYWKMLDSDIKSTMTNDTSDALKQQFEFENLMTKDPSPLNPFGQNKHRNISQPKGPFFQNLRREKEATYFFFPGIYASSFSYFLKKYLVTGWDILVENDVYVLAHEGVDIPDVYLTPDAKTPEENIACLVSYYDPDDMNKAYQQLLLSPEWFNWHKDIAAKAKKDADFEEAMRKDPPPKN